MLTNGYLGCLASIVDMMEKVITELSNARIVCKFLDVFLEELPRLPSDREIEFEIQFLFEIALISKAPY